MRRLLGLSGVVALAGCASLPGVDPLGWWHQQEGGRIAEPRPAAPGAEAAWPNLSSVPTRPQADDAATRGRIAAGLVADRANAQYATGSALPPPGRVPVAAPAAASGMNASLEAADRPAVPAPPPRPAPVTKVAATPLAAPVAAPVTDTPMPAIPDGPPAPPGLPGVRQTTIAAPAPVAPPAVQAAPVLPPGAPVTVAFADGAAELPAAARTALIALAGVRAGRTIVVAGFGEAPEGDPAAQSRALPLAWERAGVIARALQAAGVPEAALNVTASAVGRGGAARLTE